MLMQSLVHVQTFRRLLIWRRVYEGVSCINWNKQRTIIRILGYCSRVYASRLSETGNRLYKA